MLTKKGLAATRAPKYHSLMTTLELLLSTDFGRAFPEKAKAMAAAASAAAERSPLPPSTLTDSVREEKALSPDAFS